ncbi:MAG: trigger factor [Ignavibacteria bacterium]|nr:trigger factor [Ignavibacteria bacterium]
MEKKLIDSEGLQKELTITLTNEELEPRFNKKYKEAQKYVEIKGFRKGRVPLNIVISRFGKMIRQNSLEDIAIECFKEIVEEEKLEVTSEPTLEKAELTEEGATFLISFESVPQAELNEYRGIKIYEPVHIVTDESVEKFLDEIRFKNGAFEEADIIEDKSYCVDYLVEEIDKETNTVKADSNINSDKRVCLYEDGYFEAFIDLFIGLKVGDTFNYSPQEFDKNAKDFSLRATIKKIEKILPAELTPELISEQSDGQFDNLDDYRDSLIFKFQEQWNDRSKKLMQEQLKDHLIAENVFDVPSYQVEREKKAQYENFINRFGGSPNKEETSYEVLGDLFTDTSENNVRWSFIVQKIVDNEELTVEEYDIDEFVGSLNLSDEIKNNEMNMKYFRESDYTKYTILEQKVFDFLLDFAETTEIPYEDYTKMLDMKRQEILKSIRDVPHEHQHEHGEDGEEFDNVYDDKLNVFDEEQESPEEDNKEENN